MDSFFAVRENFVCYDNLKEFEELYKRLEEKGVKIPLLAAPMRKLMEYNISDSNSTLGVHDVDLNAQRRFFTSPLWNQFEKQRAVLMLQQAKDKEHGESRDKLLKMWDAVPQEAMCAETMKEVQMARSLFLSTLPLPSRVRYALEDESHVSFAADWKADFDFKALLYFGTTPASFDGLTFQGFLDTYNLILLHGLQGLVKNPIMKIIVEYGVSLAACTAEKTWWPEFLKLTVAVRLGLLRQWCGTETPVFDEIVVDVESIDKVERETAKLLANIKGDRPWMTALKQRSKEIRAAKTSKSPAGDKTTVPQAEQNAGDKTTVPPQAEQHAGDKTAVVAELEKTKPADAEITKPAEVAQPDGTDVRRDAAAASSAEASPPSPKPKEEAPPRPQEAKEKARDSRYVPTCQVGDIVIVRAFREEYNGFKGKVLAVLTGDVKVEMLEGPTVGNTKKTTQKFKFAQVKKVTDKEEKAEPENKESKKPKKSSGFQDLNTWLADATQDVT
jgi:hypothetical protein